MPHARKKQISKIKRRPIDYVATSKAASNATLKKSKKKKP
jgi:hypothetical protein